MPKNTTRRIEINAACQDLSRVTAKAWQGIKGANKPEFLFRHFGRIVRIESDDGGSPFLQDVSEYRMRFTLARVADWYKINKEGQKIFAKPPVDVVRDVLATPDPPLPILSRMVEVAIFGADGSLITNPGYHAASQTYHSPPTRLQPRPVSAKPTDKEIAEARELILIELLGDFPFADDASPAHSVALLLHPFCIFLFHGPSPLHLIHKPCPATGGTLLAEMLHLPALGEHTSMMPPVAEDEDHPAWAEEEWRKRITAKLLTAPSMVLIDNVRSLTSSVLSAAITAPIWEDRVLNFSKVGRVPVRCAWVATGNNPALSNEISSRIVSIRLDSGIEDPATRTNFRHPDIRQWALENRSALVWAAQTLVMAWIARGRSIAPGKPRLARFEGWSDVMGGILSVAGIPGFLSNVENFREVANPERESIEGFLDIFEYIPGAACRSGRTLPTC